MKIRKSNDLVKALPISLVTCSISNLVAALYLPGTWLWFLFQKGAKTAE